MGDADQGGRRNPARAARAPRPQEPEGGEPEGDEPPQDQPEPTEEELAQQEAARQEAARRDAEALAAAEREAERQEHQDEITRMQAEIDTLRQQSPEERRNTDGITLIGNAVRTMTSILRQNTNISKKQLEFQELLNADATADAMLKQQQLTDPTMGNSSWYTGVLSSEQSRHFSKGIITSKEFSYSKANNEFQKASKPNDMHFPRSLEDLPDTTEAWKASFNDSLQQIVMESPDYHAYVTTSSKVTDYINSRIEIRMKEIRNHDSTKNFEFDELQDLQIPPVEGAHMLSAVLVKDVGEFPPRVTTPGWQFGVLEPVYYNDGSSADQRTLLCIPSNFSSLNLTDHPPFIPFNDYTRRYYDHLLHKVQGDREYCPNPRRVPGSPHFCDRDHMDLEEFNAFDKKLFDLFMSWLKKSMTAIQQPAKISEIEIFEKKLRRTNNCCLIYAALQWTNLYLCGNSNVVAINIRNHVNQVKHRAMRDWPNADLCHILAFYLTAEDKIKIFSPRNVSHHLNMEDLLQETIDQIGKHVTEAAWERANGDKSTFMHKMIKAAEGLGQWFNNSVDKKSPESMRNLDQAVPGLSQAVGSMQNLLAFFQHIYSSHGVTIGPTPDRFTVKCHRAHTSFAKMKSDAAINFIGNAGTSDETVNVTDVINYGYGPSDYQDEGSEPDLVKFMRSMEEFRELSSDAHAYLLVPQEEIAEDLID